MHVTDVIISQWLGVRARARTVDAAVDCHIGISPEAIEALLCPSGKEGTNVDSLAVHCQEIRLMLRQTVFLFPSFPAHLSL